MSLQKTVVSPTANKTQIVVSYLFNRLKEPSTWRGIIAMGIGLGWAVTDIQIEYIVTAGLGFIGLIGAIFPDKILPTTPADHPTIKEA